jgi:hypothetical protein
MLGDKDELSEAAEENEVEAPEVTVGAVEDDPV